MNETPRLINVSDGQIIEINSEKFSVGRSLKSNFVLDSVYISRTHFILEKKDGSWILQDNSSNGTLLNGRMINFGRTRTLANGDLIKLVNAEKEFRFELRPVDHSHINNEQQCKASDPVICIKDVAEVNGHNILNDHCYVESNSGPHVGTFQKITGAVTNTSVTSTLIPGLSSNTDISNQRKRNSSPEPQCPVGDDSESPSKKNKTGSPEINVKSKEEEKVNKITERNSQDEGKSAAEQNFDLVEQEMRCSICSEMFVKAVTLNCCHTFCKYCIEQWRKRQDNCPICRNKILTMAPTLVLDNFIDKLVDQMDEETKQHRKEIIQCRLTAENEQKKSVASTSKKLPQTSSTTTSSATTSTTTSGTTLTMSSDEDYDDDYSEDYSDQDDYDGFYDYNGVPGKYYGGYGRCYNCNRTGHWANGCPYR